MSLLSNERDFLWIKFLNHALTSVWVWVDQNWGCHCNKNAWVRKKICQHQILQTYLNILWKAIKRMTNTLSRLTCPKWSFLNMIFNQIAKSSREWVGMGVQKKAHEVFLIRFLNQIAAARVGIGVQDSMRITSLKAWSRFSFSL